MKKFISMLIVLALCAGIAVSGAETTVSAKEFDAIKAELNTASNLLIITDKDTRMKYVADTELNPLSEQYDYVAPEGKFFKAANEEWHYGLLDTQGKLILPLEYATIEVLSDKWIAGIRLVEAEEVYQNVWLNRVDQQLLDLQGNVLADFSAYKFAQLDSESGLVKLEGEDGKVGLADSTGREILPCKYDKLSYALAGALLSGYIYAEKDGMIGFVNLETCEETGFTVAKEAGDQRANYIIIKDTGDGKGLISAAAGELPGRYQDINAFFPKNGDACLYAVVKEQDGTCRVIGQKGEEILPGVTFKNTGDAKLSEDGTLILVAGEDGKYTLYTVAYDPE